MTDQPSPEPTDEQRRAVAEILSGLIGDRTPEQQDRYEARAFRVLATREARIASQAGKIAEGLYAENFHRGERAGLERAQAVSEAFGLSCASYLVIPRLALESMSDEWQARFVAMIEEVCDRFDFEPPRGYRVHAISESGRFMHDDWSDYRRGTATERGR